MKSATTPSEVCSLSASRSLDARSSSRGGEMGPSPRAGSSSGAAAIASRAASRSRTCFALETYSPERPELIIGSVASATSGTAESVSGSSFLLTASRMRESCAITMSSSGSSPAARSSRSRSGTTPHAWKAAKTFSKLPTSSSARSRTGSRAVGQKLCTSAPKSFPLLQSRWKLRTGRLGAAAVFCRHQASRPTLPMPPMPKVTTMLRRRSAMAEPLPSTMSAAFTLRVSR